MVVLGGWEFLMNEVPLQGSQKHELGPDSHSRREQHCPENPFGSSRDRFTKRNGVKVSNMTTPPAEGYLAHKKTHHPATLP